MTKAKSKDLLRVFSSRFIKRRHYACLVREDLLFFVKSECERLNCSQGVFLELLILSHQNSFVVRSEDVFQYDSLLRSVHSTAHKFISPSAFSKLLHSQAVP